MLTAEEARETGLVARVVPDADLDREVSTLAGALARSSPSALALTKQLFYRLDGRTLDEGIALGARVNALARQTPDFRAAIAQFLRK
jgi:enoyl-CoA hydratase/carnithine racemase